jgi:hypothetical protein
MHPLKDNIYIYIYQKIHDLIMSGKILFYKIPQKISYIKKITLKRK